MTTRKSSGTKSAWWVCAAVLFTICLLAAGCETTNGKTVQGQIRTVEWIFEGPGQKPFDRTPLDKILRRLDGVRDARLVLVKKALPEPVVPNWRGFDEEDGYIANANIWKLTVCFDPADIEEERIERIIRGNFFVSLKKNLKGFARYTKKPRENRQDSSMDGHWPARFSTNVNVWRKEFLCFAS